MGDPAPIWYTVIRGDHTPLADPGGGAHTRRAPGRGPMIFHAQNANFSHFFSSLAIQFKSCFNRFMAKTC